MGASLRKSASDPLESKLATRVVFDDVVNKENQETTDKNIRKYLVSGKDIWRVCFFFFFFWPSW